MRHDHDDPLRAGLRVSQVSFAWTIAAGITAIAIGVVGNSLALITFGAIGLLDGIGSASLIVHFRHARRHQAVSERHERRSLLIITAGLAVIGIATAADSAYRLATHAASKPPILGTVLAALSMLMLVFLALRKQQIARRIPSHALHSDGWVSGVGAVLALVVLIGTALAAGLGLWWVDAVAAILVACGAVTLAAWLLHAAPD